MNPQNTDSDFGLNQVNWDVFILKQSDSKVLL